MLPAYNIYIGYDSRFPLVSDVLRYSLVNNTSQKDKSRVNDNIVYLSLADLKFERNFKPKADNKASTEFTYSRFLIPYLENYNGISIFMDNDMLCFSDITDLIALLNIKYRNVDNYPAIICRKHAYNCYQQPDGTKMYGVKNEPYPRKNWSSFMIMNCTKLLCWTKTVVEQADGARLHQFKDIPDEEIVDIETIEPGWNDLTFMRPETKLLHYTEGGPWFDQYYNCPHALDWYKAFREYFGYDHPNYTTYMADLA